MAIGDLYKYSIINREEGRIDASLQIDPNHPVYRGHFPGFPVTPGVCQILMIREILEEELGILLILTGARQIKFTSVHEPGTEPEIDAAITFKREEDRLEVAARLLRNEKAFLKFKGEFREQ